MITLISVVAVPTLAAALFLPGVASAKGTKAPKGVSGTCASLTGNINTTVLIAGCNPQAAGSDGGTFNFSAGAASGSSSISWTDGATTIFSFGGKIETPLKGTKANKKFKCVSGDTTEFLLKGKVGKNPAGNTGLPSGDVGFGGSVKADVCVDASGGVSLRAGVFSL